MADQENEDDEKSSASSTLDVNENASTRTIRVSFRQKARALRKAGASVEVSKKSFEELNEAYQTLMAARQKGQGKDLSTKHVSVLSSDVANYSGMIAANEKETLEFFQFCRDVFEEIVEKHQGRVFNTAGDAILAEFPYVLNAVDCAVEIQSELRTLNLGQPEGRRIQFRMGLNIGDVYVNGTDLLGDTVNVAARLQTAAKPGGICISKGVYELIRNKTLHDLTFVGDLNFKNIPHIVRTYAVSEGTTAKKEELPEPPPLPNVGKEKTGEIKRPRKEEAKTSGAGSKLVSGLLVAAAVVGAIWFLRPAPKVIVVQAPPPIEREPQKPVAPVAPAPMATAPEKEGALAGNISNAGSFPNVDAELVKQAQQGDLNSQYSDGMKYLGSSKFDEAYMFFSMSARAGSTGSQLELGKLYHDGHGTAVPKDMEASLYWLLHAAMGQNTFATNYLLQHEADYGENSPFIRNQKHVETETMPSEKQRYLKRNMDFLGELHDKLRDRNVPTLTAN